MKSSRYQKYQSSSSHDESWVVSYADLVTNLLLFFATMAGASQMTQTNYQRVAQSFHHRENQSQKSLLNIEKRIKEEIQEQNLTEAINVSMKKNGLQISFDSTVLFQRGHANIAAQWDKKIAKLIHILKPYQDVYSFAVEGHSDPVPMRQGGAFSSNWELSSARAANIRKRMEAGGIHRSKTHIEAYADTKPIPLQTAYDQYRRVVVRIF